MGVWSAAVYGSDTACDIKNDFFVRYNRGEDAQSIKKEIIEQFGDEEKCEIIFALADCMWQIGALEDDLLSQVADIVSSGEDIEHAKELGADENFINQRKKITEKFIKKISVKKTNPKKRMAPPVPVNSKYSNGTVLAFQYSDDTWGVLIVIGGKHFDIETYYTYIQTSLRTKEKPTMEDVYTSYIIDRSFHNFDFIPLRSPSLYYTFANCISGYLKKMATKRFEVYNDQFFEIIGYLSNWGECSSGVYSTLGYYAHKTYDEFEAAAKKELTERYSDNPQAYTEMTVKEIEEELTSQDPNVIIEKYNICRSYDKIIQFIEGLPQDQKTPDILRSLAIAYNNIGDVESLQKAVKILIPIKDKLTDFQYCYTLGYSYYYLSDYDRALPLICKALSCCEINEKTVQMENMIKNIENVSKINK